MMIILATGVKELDEEIKKVYTDAQKADFIEEVKGTSDMAVLSVYLPSAMAEAEDTGEMRIKRFLMAVSRLKAGNKDVNIVAMIGSEYGLLDMLMEFEVYNIIPGNEVSSAEILDMLENPKDLHYARKLRNMLYEKEKRMPSIDVEEVEEIIEETKPPKETAMPMKRAEIREFPKHEELKDNKGTEWIFSFPDDEEVKKDVVSEKPVIGIWSPKPNTGAGTVARSLSIAAAEKRNVVLVELDYYYPSIAYSMGISHPERNLQKAIANCGEAGKSAIPYLLDINSAVNSLSDARRKLAPYIRKLPDKLCVLCCDGERGIEDFPSVEDGTAVNNILEELTNVFDVTIVKLPSEVNDIMFAAGVTKCTHMITVLDPNPVTLALFRQRKELLKKMGIKCPMAYVANMTTREFPASFVEENAGVRILEGIPYDTQMLKEVYAMNFSGTDKFKRSIDRLVRKIGLLKWESGVVEAKKRFKIFNIAGGMFR